MTRIRIAAGSFLALALLVSGAVAAEQLTSGPQVGDKVPGPFEPLNVTGPDAGKERCLYCKNGTHPVAMIFAREVSKPVARLIKKIDQATAHHSDAHMGSFVVFLSGSDAMPEHLKKLAEKEGIKHTILSVMESAPKAYDINPQADVTVVLYTNHTVKANYAFEKGQLTDKEIDHIVSAVPKILPAE
jgi:protein-disulfide isomerase